MKLSRKIVWFLIGLLIPLMLATCMEKAHAYEWSIGYSPGCFHWDRDKNYNEDNNHVFMVSVDNWFGITFRNSYFDRVIGFGYIFRTPKLEKHDFFIRGNLPVGLIHGYHNRTIEVGGISPAAIPALELGYLDVSVNITVYPVVVALLTITF